MLEGTYLLRAHELCRKAMGRVKNRGRDRTVTLILYEHSRNSVREELARLLSFKSSYALLNLEVKYLLEIDSQCLDVWD